MDGPHLSDFPEELLERILSYCVVAPLTQPCRPSWHRSGSSAESPAPIRGRLALLLVCKTFLRICTPLFYHTVHIASANQLRNLLSDSLRPNRFLANHIRRVVFSGIWEEGGDLLRMCGANVKLLDITLDVSQLVPVVEAPVSDLDAERFCEALNELESLTHVVIRKPNNVYLTHPKPRYVLAEIAKAMQNWENLDHADIAFRLSDDSGAIASALSIPRVQHAQQGPITALTQALSTRPKLHTLSTLLPSVWNETILRISVNPSLERIILADGNSGPVSMEGSHGIASTGLFLLGAKKHARLNELIKAGTYIMRTRAQTMGTPSPPPTRAALPMVHRGSISSSTQYSAASTSRSRVHPNNASRYYSRSQSTMPSNDAAQSSCIPMQGQNAKRTTRRSENSSCHPI